MRTLTILMAALLALAVTAPTASAAVGGIDLTTDPSDECNGVFETDGCYYSQNGFRHYCKIWVGVCVEGG